MFFMGHSVEALLLPREHALSYEGRRCSAYLLRKPDQLCSVAEMAEVVRSVDCLTKCRLSSFVLVLAVLAVQIAKPSANV